MSESVKVYLDGDDKWRWRWTRGSRVVGSSSQGYTSKQWCMANLELTLRGDFVKTHQHKKGTPNGRLYVEGHIAVAESDRKVPVVITPWQED